MRSRIHRLRKAWNRTMNDASESSSTIPETLDQVPEHQDRGGWQDTWGDIPEFKRRSRWQAAAKRSIDLIMGSAMMIAVSPAMLLIAIAVKLSSKGPVLFAHTRVGRMGRTFILYKFRTMVADDTEFKRDLLSQNEATGPVFKIKRDPRVTRVGRILRVTSMDELPQLWNVLRGDMSLVGPRPAMPTEVEEYEPWQRRRLLVLPGITCIWQVSGRSNIGFEEWMRMDLEYIENWSLLLDLKLLVMTLPAILSMRGAG